MNLIIYRGPLERARLAFIFETLKDKFEDLSFIWISPRVNEGDRKYYSDLFISEYSFSKSIILEHTYKDYFSTQSEIKKFIGSSKVNFLGLIGFSALEFGLRIESSKKVWFINGVPEENGFSGKSFLEDRKVDIIWGVKKMLMKNIDLVVTVSNRMNQLVNKRLKISNAFAAPTCVDTSVFGTSNSQRIIDFCYLGSGASWQAIDLLAEVWSNLYKLDSTLRFRVISRDERTHILAKNIPETNIEFVSSHEFKEVAQYISECKAGFLLRKDHIVNKVCFPTKLAEYLASGCWVVSTNIDWDIKDYFEKYNIGLLVSPVEKPKEIAKQILKYRNRNFSGEDQAKEILICTSLLDKKYWKKLLIERLN